MKHLIRTGICLFMTCCLLLAGLTGCGEPEQKKSGQPLSVAFITDLSAIEDHSYNAAIWEGAEKFAENRQIACSHYSADRFFSESSSEKSGSEADEQELRESAIKQAVQDGAALILCAGESYAVPVYHMQMSYPETSFVLIDAEPHSETGEKSVGPRTCTASFAEEEAGYMAGYAAVKDGDRLLGFMGGKEEPAVCRFGYGFVQGAEAAAAELNLPKNEVKIRYAYMNTYAVDPAVLAQAAKWYKDGITCIFAC